MLITTPIIHWHRSEHVTATMLVVRLLCRHKKTA
jgi:hypothetical protein